MLESELFQSRLVNPVFSGWATASGCKTETKWSTWTPRTESRRESSQTGRQTVMKAMTAANKGGGCRVLCVRTSRAPSSSLSGLPSRGHRPGRNGASRGQMRGLSAAAAQPDPRGGGGVASSRPSPIFSRFRSNSVDVRRRKRGDQRSRFRGARPPTTRQNTRSSNAIRPPTTWN